MYLSLYMMATDDMGPLVEENHTTTMLTHEPESMANNNKINTHDQTTEESTESVRKRYESMTFDEMSQQMAESYRQLSQVLGHRVSTPSATSSDKTTDTPTYDIPDDDNHDDDDYDAYNDNMDDERIVDRDDVSDAIKRRKMNTLLSRSASSGDTAKVNQLLSDPKLRAYIDVDAKDDDGGTPLIYAACFGKVEIAQALLDAGAKTNIQDSCK